MNQRVWEPMVSVLTEDDVRACTQHGQSERLSGDQNFVPYQSRRIGSPAFKGNHERV